MWDPLQKLSTQNLANLGRKMIETDMFTKLSGCMDNVKHQKSSPPNIFEYGKPRELHIFEYAPFIFEYLDQDNST